MIGTIRHHQKWLWAVIITATIISFVVYFSPDAKWGKGAVDEANFGTIAGKPITREMMNQAYRETQLRYFFSYGQWPGRDSKQMGFDVDREALNRLFLIDKIKTLGVQVGDDAAAQWIADNFRDRQQKVFRKESYDRFVGQVLPQAGVKEPEFQTFVRHEVGIQHLILLAGQSGRLVSQQEAEELYRVENQPVTVDVIYFSLSNHLAQVSLTPDALSQFYTNRQSVYRLAERVQVSYVRWSKTNFLAEADATMAKNTNLSFSIDSYYVQRGAEAFKDPSGNPLPAEAAKIKIREDMRQELALIEARKKASQFAQELYEVVEKATTKSASDLEKVATQKNLKVEVTEPFGMYDGPTSLKVGERFTRAAFSLSNEEPFILEPIVGEDGVYVIALKAKLPSEVPPLDSVRARVTEDFKRAKALEAARAEGTAVQAKLTNGLAAGKKFEAVCLESKVAPVRLTSFSRATKELPEFEFHAEFASLKNVAFGLQPGKVSEFSPSREGGFIVHLVSKQPVDESKVKSEMKEYVAKLQDSRQFQAFQEWFRHERELARIETATTAKDKKK